ncbi:hypothetical protein FRC02_003062 [Tulasnella sp. 418]|nr:hypothetical protein FRC02_003062 [Tulasnella sp. 418]
MHSDSLVIGLHTTTLDSTAFNAASWPHSVHKPKVFPSDDLMIDLQTPALLSVTSPKKVDKGYVRVQCYGCHDFNLLHMMSLPALFLTTHTQQSAQHNQSHRFPSSASP